MSVMGRKKKNIEEIETLPPQIELNFDAPEKTIDFNQVEQLCFIQATVIEIRAKLECSEQTLENQCQKQFGKSFLDYHTEKKALGRLLIRQTQFEMMRGQPQVYKQDGKKQYGKGDWRTVQWLSAVFLGQNPAVKNDPLPQKDDPEKTKLSKMSTQDLEKIDEIFRRCPE